MVRHTGRKRQAPAATLPSRESTIAAISSRSASDWSAEERRAVITWLSEEKYEPLIRQGTRLLGDPFAAQDVVQEFLMDLVSSKCDLSHFAPEHGQLWPTYIRACFRNFASKAWKRRLEEAARLAPPPEWRVDYSPSYDGRWLADRFAIGEPVSRGGLLPIEKTVEHKRCLEYMRECFRKLTVHKQQAFYHTEIDGWSARDLQTRLGGIQATWRKRLQHAREEIRDCVTRRYRQRWANERRKSNSNTRTR